MSEDRKKPFKPPFDDIGDMAERAASYCRSVREAAWRNEEIALVVSLKQLRLCVLHMINVYKDFLEPHGPNGAAAASRPDGDIRLSEKGTGVPAERLSQDGGKGYDGPGQSTA